MIAEIKNNPECNWRLRKIRLPSLIMVIIMIASQLMACVSLSAPVIESHDTGGSWEDTFEDMVGIETWDNLILSEGDIELERPLTVFDAFTGNDGDPPNPVLWDVLDDGYTLEIESNTLKASVSPAVPTFKYEMVRTKNSFSGDHYITWKQNLHTTSGGMFYHFFVLDGSDDSYLFGVNQNSANKYHLYNYKSTVDTRLRENPVSGWTDFRVYFSDGYMEYYIDGIKEWFYTFSVSSVKYQFGTAASNQVSTIYTDDINATLYRPTGNLTSTEIVLPNGNAWESLIIDKSEFGSENDINVSILENGTYQPIPGFENLTGTSIDLSTLDRIVYPSIHIQAHFSSNGYAAPILHGWKVTWLDVVPPATPSGLKVNNPDTGYSLILSWSPNNETDLDNYVLYYSTDNVTFYWLGNYSAQSTSYIHYGLSIGATYYYMIAAADFVPNQSPFSEVVEGVPDMDYDDDGIGDTDDPDDDNDGILDVDDPQPKNPLNYLEETVGNINTTVNDIQTKVAEIQLDIDTMNTTLSDIQSDIDYLNQTLPLKIDDLSTQLSVVNDSLTNRVSDAEINILDYLKGLNTSLSDDIQNLLMNITNDIISMNSSLSDQLLDLMNGMTTEHDALQQWLDIVLGELDSNLTATNDTLHKLMNDLDNLVTGFFDSLTTDIGDINSDLQLHDQNTGQNHSDIIGLLNDLLNGQIEKEKIAELRTMLIDLAENLSEHDQSIADDIMDVVTDIDEFESETDRQLEGINTTLDDLEKLEEILGDLNALDQSLDQAEEDIQDSIDDRSTKKEDEERFFMIELFLIILLILLIINMILTISLKKQVQSDKADKIPRANIEEDREIEETALGSDMVGGNERAPPRPPVV